MMLFSKARRFGLKKKSRLIKAGQSGDTPGLSEIMFRKSNPGQPVGMAGKP
jgi:hypothetical protein